MPHGAPLELTVLLDSPDEGWRSMDLCGEMLVAQLRSTMASEVRTRRVDIRLPRLGRRLLKDNRGFNLDRALGRYLIYPARTVGHRVAHPGLFHVVDHSYALLAHVLDASLTGVFCHDLDAFAPALDPGSRSTAQRALARTLLRGTQRAALVFHTTRAVRQQALARGIFREDQMVQAPLGISDHFFEPERAREATRGVLAPLQGRPYLLHVSSGIPRKRIDVLFEVFARLRARHPELALVQQGADLTDEQRALARRLGIEDALFQPGKLPHELLPGLYAGARLVLIPSDAEGFGLPLLEALACGAPVLASEIDALQEVGSHLALYAPRGDVAAWTELADAILTGRISSPPREARIARAREFSWTNHARIILDAYSELWHRKDRGGKARA